MIISFEILTFITFNIVFCLFFNILTTDCLNNPIKNYKMWIVLVCLNIFGFSYMI